MKVKMEALRICMPSSGQNKLDCKKMLLLDLQLRRALVLTVTATVER